jgi:NAD(P)-dependent dehydrogenase (short-subunit alcohol dehydrogenase family)
MTMEDPLGYDGAHVVVTGAASGMGRATAQILVDLGAEVTAIDINETDVGVARSMHVDLRDPRAITAAADAVEGPLDSVSAAPACRARRSPSSTPCS